jgi:predicted DNA-binding transcriptional regulator AlpA
MVTEKKQANVERDMMLARGFLPVKEVAERMGKSSTTIYRWIEDERVIGETIPPRNRYVQIESLAEFLGHDVAKGFGFHELMPKRARAKR